MPKVLQNYSPDDVIEFLGKVSPFERLTTDELRAVAHLLWRQHFEAGECVFSQGDHGSEAYIIESGKLSFEKLGHVIRFFEAGEVCGRSAMVNDMPRSGSAFAVEPSTVLVIDRRRLENPDCLSPRIYGKICMEFARMLTNPMSEEEAMYRELDVLLVQDGGCAPGYNPVTAFITEYLEHDKRRVFVAKEGFISLVKGRTEDYRRLVYSPKLYHELERIPGVIFSPPLREARGADFRTERYSDFKKPEIQAKAVEEILRRKVKVLVGIGGNGTFAGTYALAKQLPPTVQVFFIPVTIDSDVSGTECIGQHTGVEVGAEKIRCYMADARTHHRCYIIEMMGAAGGYHALHSCLGAGAHLAVLPQSNFDMKKLAELIGPRQSTVIVVAEGYKAEERKAKGIKQNAAEYFRDELLAAGLKTEQRIVCEAFSRDIRGAKPNNMDITLAQRMARKLAELIRAGETQMMPAVLADKEYAIPFSEIRTENSVDSDLAALANRIGGVHSLEANSRG
ncbi:MAG: 6-phosphofructokinase [Chloroherpetonaceae bacterium]|nr:6-phosphofructokinase [Chloroherpetonaceae bacterium]MCS7210216.1 6-phosphofructokinase [Chloroherpetonaceae bacterium]MDW8018487.1 6-phosphofructokinase [Chloroherpetonaceae bacterium]